MDRGAWRAMAHGVAESWKWLKQLGMPAHNLMSTHAPVIGEGQSVSQFSRSVTSDSLRPHGLQHARLPCPSPTPRVYSNSCPSCRWEGTQPYFSHRLPVVTVVHSLNWICDDFTLAYIFWVFQDFSQFMCISRSLSWRCLWWVKILSLSPAPLVLGRIGLE